MEESVVTVTHPWVLLLLSLPALFCFLEWSRSGAKLRLILKTLALVLVVLALAQPSIITPDNRTAVQLLLDTSAGLTEADLERGSQFMTELQKRKGRHSLSVIPFASETRTLTPDELKNRKLAASGDSDRRSTNLETAVRDAIASAPGSMSPRIVLVSDGRENQGSSLRAAWLAREAGVPIDTVPLAGRTAPGLRLERVVLPGLVFAGEKFPIDLVVSSPGRANATVELFAEGKKLGGSSVQLQPGGNSFRVHSSINTTGAVQITGSLRSDRFGEERFERALVLERPNVLYLSNDPPGTGRNLLAALSAAQFTLDARAEVPANLDRYQLVVFNNWNLDSVPEDRKQVVEKYVTRGGGLLVIGGERNVFDEKKKQEHAIDRVLPAKLAPPRTPEGTCVVLIIDKSSSMEGRKMELARLSAIGVIDNLRPEDQVGVLIFDNTNQWAVPIRRAEDRATIKRLVAGITPDGGTQIAPALAEAYRRIQLSTATYRHIVLLTDGISEEGDSISISKDASTRKVTISTVGLGQDVNRAYLEKVATFAKGKSYFLTDPSGLEQILLRDVMEHTGSTTVEKLLKPEVLKAASPVLEGIDMGSAPALKGYVKFEAKPGAETILRLDEKDPLLTMWQSGLGRTAVFASDAKSRWADQWVNWAGFDRFWINLMRDLLPHAQTSEASVEYDTASGNLEVEYRLGAQAEDAAKSPELFVFGPDKFQKPLLLRKVAPRVYRGEMFIGNRQGLFRVRPLEESREFPETGLYRQEEEMHQFGTDEALLRQLAQYTGGRYNPDPAQIFSLARRPGRTVLELWPVLLGLAIVANLLELLIRKWDGIVRTLRGWRSARQAKATA
jgi:uncharacterized membrane protein